MDPVIVIVWIGVAVFAVSSLIAILYSIGRMPGMKEEHGKLLFRILIADVVVGSVAVFTYFIQSHVLDQAQNHLPVSKLMIYEQIPPILLYDDNSPLYIRSPDVSRARRIVDLELAANAEFSQPISVELKSGEPKAVTLGDSKYQLSFARMGTVDADPNEKQSKNEDFAFLSVSKQQ